MNLCKDASHVDYDVCSGPIGAPSPSPTLPLPLVIPYFIVRLGSSLLQSKIALLIVVDLELRQEGPSGSMGQLPVQSFDQIL